MIVTILKLKYINNNPAYVLYHNIFYIFYIYSYVYQEKTPDMDNITVKNVIKEWYFNRLITRLLEDGQGILHRLPVHPDCA